MVYPNPGKEDKKVAVPISAWDCPLLTFAYPKLEDVAHQFDGSKPVEGVTHNSQNQIPTKRH